MDDIYAHNIGKYEQMECIEKWILKQLKRLNIERPTTVQWNCIPEALKGTDIIASAKTGSGKTLAFVVPILQTLSVDPYGIYALVLTPTRELAFQIGDQFKAVGAPMNVKVSVIIGGLDKVTQGGELNKVPHVVVATPGRLADIISTSPEFTLKRIKYLVIDEADRLLDGRFNEQLKTIWSALPIKRQTLMFSATITDEIETLKKVASNAPFIYEAPKEQETVSNLDEKYVLLNPLTKDASLVTLLKDYQSKNPKALVIIFTETCKNAQVLTMMLQEFSMKCLCLHSMMKQKDRLNSLSRFKSTEIKILIATDLASRGLDIPLVELVINHCIPNIPKTYVHRVGRTARAGRSGMAITFVIRSEIKCLLAIEGFTKRKLTELELDDKSINKILREVNITKRQQQIKLEETGFDERRLIIKEKQKQMREWERQSDSEEEEKEAPAKRKKEIKQKSSKKKKLQKNI